MEQMRPWLSIVKMKFYIFAVFVLFCFDIFSQITLHSFESDSVGANLNRRQDEIKVFSDSKITVTVYQSKMFIRIEEEFNQFPTTIFWYKIVDIRKINSHEILYTVLDNDLLEHKLILDIEGNSYKTLITRLNWCLMYNGEGVNVKFKGSLPPQR